MLENSDMEGGEGKGPACAPVEEADNFPFLNGTLSALRPALLSHCGLSWRLLPLNLTEILSVCETPVWSF